MTKAGIVIAVVLALVAGAAWAKDIVSMPEATMMGAGNLELAYIYWDLENINTPSGVVRDYAHVGEFFLGITDWLELDYIHIELQGHVNTPFGDPLSDRNELNLYIKLADETPDHPAVTIGATNLLGNDWLPSDNVGQVAGDHRTSPFIIFSQTLRPPKGGPPDWDNPAIRLQIGAGFNFHEDKPFGILQFAFTPHVVAAFQHYRGDPGWLVGWHERNWGIDVGGLSGDNWVHVSYDLGLW
ncbi:MAG: hypothetical protein J7M26_07040 [Armatimonadetes bacterium]|nr:hypothetical protein [Armatimonadota bacterium]